MVAAAAAVSPSPWGTRAELEPACDGAVPHDAERKRTQRSFEGEQRAVKGGRAPRAARALHEAGRCRAPSARPGGRCMPCEKPLRRQRGLEMSRRSNGAPGRQPAERASAKPSPRVPTHLFLSHLSVFRLATGCSRSEANAAVALAQEDRRARGVRASARRRAAAMACPTSKLPGPKADSARN